MKPFTDRCRHVAVFLDNQGHYLCQEKLKYESSSFVHEKLGYVFSPGNSSFFKVTSLLYSTKYYFYNVGCSTPLNLTLPLTTNSLDPKEFGVLIRTQVLTELNNLAKASWWDGLLNPWTIAIVCIVGGLIWYFNKTGGKLH